MKEGGREGEVEGLHAKFHMNVFIVLAGFRWPETTFLAFFYFCGLLFGPFLPMKVKFGVLKQTECLHLHAN